MTSYYKCLTYKTMIDVSKCSGYHFHTINVCMCLYSVFFLSSSRPKCVLQHGYRLHGQITYKLFVRAEIAFKFAISKCEVYWNEVYARVPIIFSSCNELNNFIESSWMRRHRVPTIISNMFKIIDHICLGRYIVYGAIQTLTQTIRLNLLPPFNK